MREADGLTPFERTLTRRLLDYSDDLVHARPSADVAWSVTSQAAAGSGRLRRWLAGFAVTAVVVAAVILVFPGLPNLGTDDPAQTPPADVADDLFTTTMSCEALLGGFTVQVTYPAEWFTSQCIWFGPVQLNPDDAGAPDGTAITLGAVPSAPRQGDEPRRGTVDGRPWIRVFEASQGGETSVTHLIYYITLDPAAGEPTMVAATSTASSSDHDLNAAVLDRMVERLSFGDGSSQ